MQSPVAVMLWRICPQNSLCFRSADHLPYLQQLGYCVKRGAYSNTGLDHSWVYTSKYHRASQSLKPK